MECALPIFAFVVFVLGACVFALIVALAIVWIARRLKRSWRFSIAAGLVWLIGFGVLFGLALLAARYAALLVLEPLTHQHISRERMVGIYEARYEWYGNVAGGFEILVLKPDGTYAQTFASIAGVVATNAGKWEFTDTKESGSQVCLREALAPSEQTGPKAKLPRENISLGVCSFFGRITMPINDDLGYRYVKVMTLGSGNENDGKKPDE